MSILPQLERDLRAAIRDREPVGQAGATAPGWRAAARAAPLVLAALVVIAISGALLLTRGPGAPPRLGGGAPSARERLIASIAVLRRPQVAADRDPRLEFPWLSDPSRNGGPNGVVARGADPRPDRALLRVVTVPALGVRVMIAPTRYRAGAPPARTEGLLLSVGNREGSVVGSGPRPTAVDSFEAHGLVVTFGARGLVNPAVMLVPDGIARVSLDAMRLRPGQFRTGRSARTLSAAVARIRADARVQDNLAALRMAVPVVAPGGYLIGPTRLPAYLGAAATARVTWRDASGRILRRTTTEVDVLIDVRR